MCYMHSDDTVLINFNAILPIILMTFKTTIAIEACATTELCYRGPIKVYASYAVSETTYCSCPSSSTKTNRLVKL